jgi:hypothetical protein
MFQLEKYENEIKTILKNICSKQEKAAPCDQEQLSKEKTKATFDFKLEGLLCERAATKRDAEQKKHRRQKHQHNEIYL